ncbi:hypothetical protein K505DRAFT_322346 [Melanomma pulvis-pyrius CBS 109.77]|uniref:Exosome complex protein n=1 Tax=Melanomma pulvis-pyrius CBS 109.77 TaxID=1314802 RepID=A0A6A6XNC0_9PLEO|nr:hypothetical protein K505DRAFT_322346 [Melanomma pulvis-pyrius CBS 109.77]
MDITTDLPAQIEDLEANIDELDAALAPLLHKPLPTTASTLPLLDKAKLHILSAYAIESLLFSSLLTAGQDAKSHAVFEELVRLKSYFRKIAAAEAEPEPKARIDKEAAARFIKHGLSGNDRYDRERKERKERAEREKEKARKKQTHIKFDQEIESARMEGVTKKRAADAVEANDGVESQQEENDVDTENEELYGASLDAAPGSAPKTAGSRKKARLEVDPSSSAPPPTIAQDTNTAPFMTVKEKRRSDRRARKQARRADRMAGNANDKEEETILPTRAPRTHSETFNALLQGPLAKNAKAKGK